MSTTFFSFDTWLLICKQHTSRMQTQIDETDIVLAEGTGIGISGHILASTIGGTATAIAGRTMILHCIYTSLPFGRCEN
jgi:hypothetical protein